MTAIFDGKKFEGPSSIDGEGIPSSPGVYLICTGSAGGDKIIALYESDDMRKHMVSNPDRGEWMRNKDDGNNGFNDDQLRAYDLLENSASIREDIIYKIVDRRPYRIPCYKPPTDDF